MIPRAAVFLRWRVIPPLLFFFLFFLAGCSFDGKRLKFSTVRFLAATAKQKRRVYSASLTDDSRMMFLFWHFHLNKCFIVKLLFSSSSSAASRDNNSIQAVIFNFHADWMTKCGLAELETITLEIQTKDNKSVHQSNAYLKMLLDSRTGRYM